MIPSETGVRVLFAADAPDLHEKLVGILRERGHSITPCPDFRLAWAAFEAEPYPMVVLARFPHSQPADDLCKRIRSHPDGTTSVILMLCASDVDGEAALDAGADDCLANTASHEQLVARLRVMEQRVLRQPLMAHAQDRSPHRKRPASDTGERHIGRLADYAPDMVLITDEARRLVDCNRIALDVLGYSRDEILRLRADDLRVKDLRDAIERDFDRTRRSGATLFETMLQRKDGSCFPVEVCAHLVEVNGKFLYHGTLRDITDRKAAEHRMLGLTRLYQMLYRTNEAMLHADSEEMLFSEVCRIAEEAGMLGAIVRMAENDDGLFRAITFSEHLRPLVENFPVFTSIKGADSDKISARAFVEDRVVVEQDRQATAINPQTRALFQAVGLRSAASLPLRRTGKRVGAITFDSSELNFFTPEIVGLLTQMAANISFALDNFDRKRLSRNAANALRASEERFRSLTAMSSDWYWEQDENFRFTVRSSPTGKAIDVPVSEILGKTRWELGAERGPEARMEEHRRLLESHKPFRNFEYSVTRPGRSPIYMSVSGDPIFDGQGRFTGYRGVGRNITDLKRNESRLVETTNDLKVAYGKLADTQEQERRALARELHDQVGHNLTALNLHLTRLEKELNVHPETGIARRISDSLGLVEDTAQRVRHIMSSLRPPMMDDYGLFATLRWWSHESAARSGIAIELAGEEIEPRLPNNVELTLFRVAQEALLNAIKHSKASRITVTLQTLPESVQLSIVDDGKGMALDEGEGGQHALLRATLGMLNMRERMEAIGGELHVSAVPGKGVQVTARLVRTQS